MESYQEKPWYKRSNSWAWIITGLCFLALIILMTVDDDPGKDNKAQQPKSYEEIFGEEEAREKGIGGHIDGPGDWKPDPNAAKNVREFIENGGNVDPAIDAIQDGDYHDLLDQNGGEEGF